MPRPPGSTPAGSIPAPAAANWAGTNPPRLGRAPDGEGARGTGVRELERHVDLVTGAQLGRERFQCEDETDGARAGRGLGRRDGFTARGHRVRRDRRIDGYRDQLVRLVAEVDGGQLDVGDAAFVGDGAGRDRHDRAADLQSWCRDRTRPPAGSRWRAASVTRSRWSTRSATRSPVRQSPTTHEQRCASRAFPFATGSLP